MPRKAKLILNPMADMGNAWKVANDLRPIVAEYGSADWSGTVYPTHAIELARQAGLEGYDMVVAVGGDGTVHEVVNGLMQLPAERRPILGIVPVGSGNDFAHATGVPFRPDHALLHALTGEAQAVDIGVLRDDKGREEYWNNTLGIGFDTVVTIRSHRLPLLRGFLMYFTAVVQTIILNFNPAQLQIQTDREDWQDSTLMLTICNGPREGGGFLLAPGAKLDDGIFNYAAVRKISRPMMFRLLPEVMKGTHGRFACVRMGDLTRLSLVSDMPLYIHTDGEIFTDFASNLRSIEVEMQPGALRVVRGQGQPA
jgi:YegS/Rv2252/BmrU family lipid kinase